MCFFGAVWRARKKERRRDVGEKMRERKIEREREREREKRKKSERGTDEEASKVSLATPLPSIRAVQCFFFFLRLISPSLLSYRCRPRPG